ncbi:hypothetical protein [Nonomuraea sp. NPDC049695]|uniref:hypothetical protein n=1 Tax=Nonomuraea sp. NPDC049695 TaxID=3154734 RepID=UPI00344AA903
MIDIWNFDPLRDIAPPYWAAAGAFALALMLAALRRLKRLFFPKAQAPDRPPRSLANAVTWACAAAALVFAGEGMFEVITRAAPEVWWLPWLGIGLLEGPLLAFALRAKELLRGLKYAQPDQAERLIRQAGQATRMTWLLASASAVISASANFDTGTPSIPLLRAAAPIVGVILWHHALRIEQDAHTGRQRESRWKWTPEYVLTRLGLVTARATETADAEVRMRLTKVADWVLRYARLVRRDAARDTGQRTWWDTRWDTFVRWRMERIYRAADRDLDLTRDASRRALLEEMIASRDAVVLLTTRAGVTHADLGRPETGQPTGQPTPSVRIIYPKPAERVVRDTRLVFHDKIVERLVERPARPIRITFPSSAGRPSRDTRDTRETRHRDTRGTAHRDGRDGTNGTANRDGGTPNRNGGGTSRTSHQSGAGKPTEKEIIAAIADAITPSGDVPIRPLALELGIPRATLHRHVAKYRETHGITPPSKGVIPAPRTNSQHADSNGPNLAPVGGGTT